MSESFGGPPVASDSAPAAPTYAVTSPVQAPVAKRRRYSPRQLVIWAVVVVVVLVGGYVYRHVTGDPTTAKVGSCMTGQSKDTIKVVGCSDATAQWTVVGKVDENSQPSSTKMDSDCAAYPTTAAEFWDEDNGDNFVLCLATK
jgi:hypothetical protein